jgi:hypothetical protein
MTGTIPWNATRRLNTMTDEFYELTQSLDRFPEWVEGARDGYLEKFDGWKDLKDAFFDCAPILID